MIRRKCFPSLRVWSRSSRASFPSFRSCSPSSRGVFSATDDSFRRWTRCLQPRKEVSARRTRSFPSRRKRPAPPRPCLQQAQPSTETNNSTKKEDTTMSTHARIADRLTTQSAEQLAATAATIITGLTENSAFPSPPVDLKTAQAAVDDLILFCWRIISLSNLGKNTPSPSTEFLPTQLT